MKIYYIPFFSGKRNDAKLLMHKFDIINNDNYNIQKHLYKL